MSRDLELRRRLPIYQLADFDLPIGALNTYREQGLSVLSEAAQHLPGQFAP